MVYWKLKELTNHPLMSLTYKLSIRTGWKRGGDIFTKDVKRGDWEQNKNVNDYYIQTIQFVNSVFACLPVCLFVHKEVFKKVSIG